MKKLISFAPCNDLALAARQATLLSAAAIEQAVCVDTLFQATSGTLRLREFRDSLEIAGADERPAPANARKARLIAEFPDEDEPGVIRVVEMRVDGEPEDAKAFFARSLGIRGVVKKERLTYAFHDALIHCDEVAGVGGFIVAELPLGEGGDLQAARGKLAGIADAFGASGPGKAVAFDADLIFKFWS